MMPAGVSLTPPPSWTTRPTGFKMAPELIVPLAVTFIVLPAETGIAVAELSAKIPAPLLVSVLSTPVETLMLPVLPAPCAKTPICESARVGERGTCTAGHSDIASAHRKCVNVRLDVRGDVSYVSVNGNVSILLMLPERLITILLESAGLLISAWIGEALPKDVVPLSVDPDPVIRMPPRPVTLW